MTATAKAKFYSNGATRPMLLKCYSVGARISQAGPTEDQPTLISSSARRSPPLQASLLLHPDTHTHRGRICGLAARPLHTAPAAAQDDIFLPKTCADTRGCSAAYRDRPSRLIRRDPWDG